MPGIYDASLFNASLRMGARLAERLGAPRGGRLELAAELAATRGECERARELFDEALREQASETFASGGRLELGGYALPETLVRECGLGAPEGEW